MIQSNYIITINNSIKVECNVTELSNLISAFTSNMEIKTIDVRLSTDIEEKHIPLLEDTSNTKFKINTKGIYFNDECSQCCMDCSGYCDAPCPCDFEDTCEHCEFELNNREDDRSNYEKLREC